jgi:hypothetical protein
MAEIDHDAEAVHLTDDLFAKGADAAVGVGASCGIADGIVAVVAEGDIGYTAVFEVCEQGEVVFDGESVFDAEDDGLLACLLVGIEMVGGAGKGKVVVVVGYDGFYLVEDEVGVGGWLKVKGRNRGALAERSGARRSKD